MGQFAIDRERTLTALNFRRERAERCVKDAKAQELWADIPQKMGYLSGIRDAIEIVKGIS